MGRPRRPSSRYLPGLILSESNAGISYEYLFTDAKTANALGAVASLIHGGGSAASGNSKKSGGATQDSATLDALAKKGVDVGKLRRLFAPQLPVLARLVCILFDQDAKGTLTGITPIVYFPLGRRANIRAAIARARLAATDSPQRAESPSGSRSATNGCALF